MKRRHAHVTVSDHAVLRWLERAQGLNVDAIKHMIAGKVLNGAELAALAVCVDKVKFMLVDQPEAPGVVVVTTVLPAIRRDRNRGERNRDERDHG